MELTDRQGQILNRVVKSYINLAEPVSSEYLKRKYRLSLSSATIRAEMQKLDDMGYLYQPHTSAGRAPTDKGYRYFVDSLKKVEDIVDEKIGLEVARMRREVEDYLIFLKDFNSLLSSLSSGLMVSCFSGTDIFIKEGWNKTFEDPEFSSAEKIKDFMEMVSLFEKNVDVFNSEDTLTQIYIGKEAPISKSDDFSIIVSKCPFFDDRDGILAILGPKRMTYDKNLLLINSIIKTLKEKNI